MRFLTSPRASATRHLLGPKTTRLRNSRDHHVDLTTFDTRYKHELLNVRTTNMRFLLSIFVSLVCVTPATAHAQIFVSELIGATGRVGEYTMSGAPVNPALISEGVRPIGVALSGNNLFVLNLSASSSVGTIGEYTTSGATINPTLISGLNHLPFTIAVSGDKLFVANAGDSTVGSGTISLFTTSGETVNRALISGLTSPLGIAISGDRLFVANSLTDTVGEYTTSGDTVNPALISGLTDLTGIAISGERLFLTSGFNGTVSEYTTSGALVNPEFLSGLGNPSGIAVSGHNLFVVDINNDKIGKYTTGGETVNADLISLSSPTSIAVGPATVPEAPSAWLLLLLGLATVLGLKSWKTA